MKIHTLKQNEYEDFVTLWGQAFGDSPEVYEEIKACFGADWKDFVLVTEKNDMDTFDAQVTSFRPFIAAALSQFVYGKLDGKTVLVSYAINTDKASRGRGYGSALTKYARDVAEIIGAHSMLSPAEPELIRFYEKLGYRPCFFALRRETECIADDRLSVKKIGIEEYEYLREQYLEGRKHVELMKPALRYIEKVSEGFYMLKSGSTSAIATVDKPGGVGNYAYIPEILTESENGGDTKAVDMIAGSFGKSIGAEKVVYTMPCAFDTPDKYVQAMIYENASTLEDKEKKAEDRALAPYFGFTFE